MKKFGILKYIRGERSETARQIDLLDNWKAQARGAYSSNIYSNNTAASSAMFSLRRNLDSESEGKEMIEDLKTYTEYDPNNTIETCAIKYSSLEDMFLSNLPCDGTKWNISAIVSRTKGTLEIVKFTAVPHK